MLWATARSVPPATPPPFADDVSQWHRARICNSARSTKLRQSPQRVRARETCYFPQNVMKKNSDRKGLCSLGDISKGSTSSSISNIIFDVEGWVEHSVNLKTKMRHSFWQRKRKWSRYTRTNAQSTENEPKEIAWHKDRSWHKNGKLYSRFKLNSSLWWRFVGLGYLFIRKLHLWKLQDVCNSRAF